MVIILSDVFLCLNIPTQTHLQRSYKNNIRTCILEVQICYEHFSIPAIFSQCTARTFSVEFIGVTLFHKTIQVSRVPLNTSLACCIMGPSPKAKSLPGQTHSYQRGGELEGWVKKSKGMKQKYTNQYHIDTDNSMWYPERKEGGEGGGGQSGINGDSLVKGTDLFFFRLSNKKMTSNTTVVIKLIPFLSHWQNIYFSVLQNFSN